MPLSYKFTKKEFDQFYKDYSAEKENVPVYFMHNVPAILSDLKKFCDLYQIDIDTKTIQETLKETVIYDYFLGNEDRNWQNLSFILTKENGKLSLSEAPMFDHEYCLNMYYFYDKLKGEEHDKHCDICGLRVSLKPHTYSKNENPDWTNIRKFMVEDIISEAQKNSKIAKQVNYCLKLNAEKLVENFEQQEKVKIDPLCKDIILYAFKSKINYFNELCKQNQKIDLINKDKNETILP